MHGMRSSGRGGISRWPVVASFGGTYVARVRTGVGGLSARVQRGGVVSARILRSLRSVASRDLWSACVARIE